MLYDIEKQLLVLKPDDEKRPGFRSLSITRGKTTVDEVGFYEISTGNIYKSLDNEKPIVRIVGDIEGSTGQVTILQENGTYRRFSRWDRIDRDGSNNSNGMHAILRTLPQCGCGGALGMPKLFDSFEEMSVYFFFTFGR